MISESNKAILKRIMPYCARAERCTRDVVQKLSSWNVPEDEVDRILEILRQEKFLDDDRYANSFVADKWKLDQWGRIKISNGLFQKGISESRIQNALDTIDPDQYISGMDILLSKKRDTIAKEAPVR
jgi:regulatory protein